MPVASHAHWAPSLSRHSAPCLRLNGMCLSACAGRIIGGQITEVSFKVALVA